MCLKESHTTLSHPFQCLKSSRRISSPEMQSPVPSYSPPRIFHCTKMFCKWRIHIFLSGWPEPDPTISQKAQPQRGLLFSQNFQKLHENEENGPGRPKLVIVARRISRFLILTRNSWCYLSSIFLNTYSSVIECRQLVCTHTLSIYSQLTLDIHIANTEQTGNNVSKFMHTKLDLPNLII